MQLRLTRLPKGLGFASVLLLLFCLFDIGLFAWLIFRSLSQREIESVLLETRFEAEGLAGKIAGRAAAAGDLFSAVALERETQTYIDSVLRQRELVQTVEVRDQHGVLVLRGKSEVTLPASGGPVVPAPEAGRLAPRIESRSVEHQSTYDVTVPIGEFGFLRIGISPREMERRIAALRQELVREAGLIGLLTIVLLSAAYVFISVLIRRGRRLEQQAAESARMAYLGTLAAGLAHEIRNPLNSLNLNMQLLTEELSGTPRPGSAPRLLAITRQEIGRLERLVSDFLSYARPRPLEIEKIEVGGLCEGMREVMAAQLADRGAVLCLDDRSGGATVAADPEQLRQVLFNLLQNALQATEGNGRVPELRLAAERRDGALVLSVADNGMGIPAADLERVFELFFSTRKGGTGLGLAIADRIVRAHGGRIEVASRVGEGTTFRVVLPQGGPSTS